MEELEKRGDTTDTETVTTGSTYYSQIQEKNRKKLDF